jgi:hypothetical protein
MLWWRLAAAAAAFLFVGPVLDPHGHDPYHGHWALSEGLRAVQSGPTLRQPAGERSPSGHPPGVVWLRGSDPSGPAVLHTGALLPAAAGAAVLQPPRPAGGATCQDQPAWYPPELEPRDPPPRRT